MISIQLWSLRDAIADLGWDAVLDRVAGAGCRHVEPFGLAATLPLIAESLTRHGITTPTAHGDLTGDQLGPTVGGGRGGRGFRDRPSVLRRRSMAGGRRHPADSR